MRDRERLTEIEIERYIIISRDRERGGLNDTMRIITKVSEKRKREV